MSIMSTSNKTTKRLRKPKPGEFIQIELPNGRYAYGRALASPMVAFYDVISPAPVGIEDLNNAKVLFIIWVMNYSFKKLTWNIIGHADLPSSLNKRVWFGKKDSISGELTKYSSWNGESTERRVTKKEFDALERAAVWGPLHVEDRLICHHEGTECKWLKD